MPNWTLVEGRLSDGLPMRLYIGERDAQICWASVWDDEHPRTEAEFLKQCGFGSQEERNQHSAVLEQTGRQVEEYFAGIRQKFDLPLALNGTRFQVGVWRQLCAIPYGTTITYGQLAARVDAPAAFRAVGNANGRNRIPLLVPCHRVLASGGQLGGFTGGIGLKQRLLAHESAVLALKPADRAMDAVQLSF